MIRKKSSDELLTFLFDSISKIASIHNQERLLVELAHLSKDIVYANRCSIWVYNKKSKKLWTKVAQDIDPIEMDDDVGIVGHAISQDKPLVINDVQSNIYFNPDIDKKTGFVTKNMIVLPMKNKRGEVIGAIQVINKEDDEPFDDVDLKYLTLSSIYIAESIGTIVLMEEIEKTQKELIYIMGVTGENRSKETGLHVKRVSEYSWLLAKLYGLSIKECDILRDVSPMHDIGKIAIPDNILNKPARLTDEEMEVMKTHTTLGNNILKNSNLSLINSASIVAYQHHEKYDGTGYPQGLKAEDIHIYGRITALADVFDALGSHRVYKEAWSDEKIFELFKEQRGKHFDPKLIDLFMENVDKFFEIRDRLRDVVHS